ncbi:MAG: DUF1175 family protein [Spirochaetes bacterium]|nr:DUF1175 family protein [Spirochaetota bacterium]
MTTVILFASCSSEISSSKLAADESSTAVVCDKRPFGKSFIRIKKGSEDFIKVLRFENDFFESRMYFSSTGKPGSAFFETSSGDIKVEFFSTSRDTDLDGFPDCAELLKEDSRMNFAARFVRIAETQFLKESPAWEKSQRDCAGLVRFAYRESLKVHNSAWTSKTGITDTKDLAQISEFSYPGIPFLGVKIFKISGGSSDDIATFGEFADAATLMHLNMDFISKDLSHAEPGDVLFFCINSGNSFSYHTMIVTEKYPGIRLIYHTGENGLIKRVNIPYLSESTVFRPSESNKNFLGVFRFKIIH